MKPDTAASGVRNSWLALAMKSTRICSVRLIAVRSCSSSVVTARRAADAGGIGLIMALDRHAEGEFDRCRPRRWPTCASSASSTPGVRSRDETCLRSTPTPITSRMARLANSTRPPVSTSISGSGRRSRTSRASGGRPARVLVRVWRLRHHRNRPRACGEHRSEGGQKQSDARDQPERLGPCHRTTPAPTTRPARRGHSAPRSQFQNDSLLRHAARIRRSGDIMRNLRRTH